MSLLFFIHKNKFNYSNKQLNWKSQVCKKLSQEIFNLTQ